MLRPQGVASVEKPSGCVGVAQRACGGSYHLMQTLDRTFLRGRGTSLLDAHAGKIILVCSIAVFVSASYIRSSLSRIGEALGVVSLLWSLLNVVLIRSVPEFSRTERSTFVRVKKLLLVFLLSLVYTFPLLITGANFLQLQPFAGRINAPSLIDFIKTPTRVNSGGISASEEDPENPNTNFVMVGESDDPTKPTKEGPAEPLSGGVQGGAPITAAQDSRPRSASAHVIGGAAPLAGITHSVLGSAKTAVQASDVPRDPITHEPISLEARIITASASDTDDAAAHPDYSAGVNPAHYAHLDGSKKPQPTVPRHVDPQIGGEDHRFAHPGSPHIPPHTAADHQPPSGGFLEATVNHQHPAHELEAGVQGGAEPEGSITHRDVGTDATIAGGAAADHRAAHPGQHMPEHTAADHLPPSGGFVEATVNHDHQPHELDGGVQGGAHTHDAPAAVDAPRPAAGGIAGGAQPTGEVSHANHGAAGAIAGGADHSDAHKGRHVPSHRATDHTPPPGGFLEATVNHRHGLDAAVEGGAQPEGTIESRDVSAQAQIEGGAAADHRAAHPGQHMPEHTAADHLPPSGGFVEATVNHDHQPHELDGGVQGGAHTHDAPAAIDAPRPAAGGIAGGAQPTGEVSHADHSAAAGIAGGADHSDAHKGHHVPAHSAADHLPPKLPLESSINHAHPGVPHEFHGGAEEGAAQQQPVRGRAASGAGEASAAAGGRKARLRAHPGTPAPRGGQSTLVSPRSTPPSSAAGMKRSPAVPTRRGFTKGAGSRGNMKEKLLERLRGKSAPAAEAAANAASAPASRSQGIKALARGGARGTEQLGARVAGGARGPERLGARVRGGAKGLPQLGARVEGGAPGTEQLGARVEGGAQGSEQLGARVRGGAPGTEMLGARVAGGARARAATSSLASAAAAEPTEDEQLQSLEAEAAADAAQEAADAAAASTEASEAAAAEQQDRDSDSDEFAVAADSAPHPAAAAAAAGDGLRSVHLKALQDLQATRQQQRSAESEAQAAEHAAQEERAAAAGGAAATSDLDEDEAEATNVN